MYGYTKFMKELVIKKKAISFKDDGGLHHYSSVTSRSLSQRKGDPRASTFPCTIRISIFARALCESWANIYLISLVMFKQLGLSLSEPMIMWLLMAYYTVKKPLGISFDILV